MISKNRDSKFIIYQVLYIFVITVLALKGADLDLSKVISREKAVEKTKLDSLKIIIDSLYKMGANFDIKINPNLSEQNTELQQRLAQTTIKLQQLTTQIKEIPPEVRVPEPKYEPPVQKEQNITQLPISFDYSFLQNTWNEVKNSGNVDLTLSDPNGSTIVVVRPGERKRFDLGSQSKVIAHYGSQRTEIKVHPKLPPEVKIERTTTKMNFSDIYVSELQRINSFKVTIIDPRPDQLKISPSGPVSVTGPIRDNKGNLVYNVMLRLAANQSQFDQWTDRNRRESDGRYKVNFFFIVVDTRTGHRVQVGDSFYFTDYAK
jgi:hypothetical protein